MENEIWKPIKGYEGYYDISNMGNVRVKDRIVYCGRGINPKIRKGRIRKQGIYRNGYKKITLSVNGVQSTILIHRLVAIHFIPNPENKPQVNHKDGDKTNNRFDNLEWVTNGENQKHAFMNGLKINIKGSKCKNSIFTESDVYLIRLKLSQGIPVKDISNEYGVSYGAVNAIRTGKNWAWLK